MMEVVSLTGPGWVAANAAKEDLKSYFRGPLSMELRQAGERVATKSVLWSYTAIRHFALSHDVTICSQNGLQSQRLLPYLPQLQTYLASLESQPKPRFQSLAGLGPLYTKLESLEKHCSARVKRMLVNTGQGRPGSNYDSYVDSITKSKPEVLDESKLPPAWSDWRVKLRVGYEMLVDTLWEVANEFNPSGYGAVLRDKLENKWCDCGCSTDHLAEVCEPAVIEDERVFGHRTRAGKGREWDGRGATMKNWGLVDEEDIWGSNLSFPFDEKRLLEELSGHRDPVEIRYLKAEREKEAGNTAFKEGRYLDAIEAYTQAWVTEPEMPHYQLNIAMAQLKLQNWMAAEEACTKSLSLHRSEKGFWRRAKARQMLGRTREAVEDLREILKLEPNNVEALSELNSLCPKRHDDDRGASSSVAMQDKVGGSGWRKLPFELHEVDFTPIRLASTKRSLPNSGRTSKESYVYPTWNAYEIQMSV
ncbi:hypothetical protein M407DRAFT_198111 [Tulasnella calospora MUT 4182]|uniref:Uncharacterized protein n=1 Tax=Tulasnella calospora MUT 4182 TaxID=1051891 RepID=A0A0C3KZB8_9AGAM|nr:hypothetical protein M407DRAFT_198111 [Tulasnella calospora MUT 4182]